MADEKVRLLSDEQKQPAPFDLAGHLKFQGYMTTFITALQAGNPGRLPEALLAMQKDELAMDFCNKEKQKALEEFMKYLRGAKAIDAKAVIDETARNTALEALKEEIRVLAAANTQALIDDKDKAVSKEMTKTLAMINEGALALLSLNLALENAAGITAGVVPAFGAIAFTEALNAVRSVQLAIKDIQAGNYAAATLKIAGALDGLGAAFITGVISLGKLDWLTQKLGLSQADGDLVTKQIFFNALFGLGAVLAIASYGLINKRITDLQSEIDSMKKHLQEQDSKITIPEIAQKEKELKALENQRTDAKWNTVISGLKELAVGVLTFTGLAAYASVLLLIMSAVGGLHKSEALATKKEAASAQPTEEPERPKMA